MATRGTEVLLSKEIRCTASQWIKDARSEQAQEELLARALQQWIGQKEPRDEHLLAVSLAAMLLMKVSTWPSEKLNQSALTEELVRTWLDICGQDHYDRPQSEPGVHPPLTATRMRLQLSELRPWLRGWLGAEITAAADYKIPTTTEELPIMDERIKGATDAVFERQRNRQKRLLASLVEVITRLTEPTTTEGDAVTLLLHEQPLLAAMEKISAQLRANYEVLDKLARAIGAETSTQALEFITQASQLLDQAETKEQQQ